MEAHEAAAHGQKCLTKEIVKEKAPLERKWASEPTANTKQSTFSDPDVKHRESLPCGATGGSAPHQKYGIPGNSAKLLSGSSAVGAIGGPPSLDPQGPFAQGFQRGYFHLAQPYPQHPQSERFVSGAKPQPGLEPHAWPFVGQLPSDDLYPVGHPGHTHPHGAGRFPRQKSPSLPSSFGQYSHSGSDPGEEGYGKKEQKPKKPGKYLCPYCNRACAKPSVLKKHIRSHTGERPYPCIPCGFSFKTKSNLYKHRKSHAHAIKAGLAPFSSEPSASAPSGDTDQASPAGEAEVPSDGEQSTDTDEEGVETSSMPMDKDSPIPQISFEADKNGGTTEPAYADSAEELNIGSMKVPILIFPKPGGVPPTGMDCPPFHDIKASHRMLGSQAGGRARSLDDSPNAKQRLALRLIDKDGQNSDPGMSQSLNLLSPHSKGSTDSGYFSPFDSAELQIGTPNTNVKTYEEIMFGRTWYNRPNSRSRQSITVNLVGADPNTLVTLKQAGTLSDMGKIVEDPVSFARTIPMCGEAKQYPTGPCQSSTGLLEPPSDSGTLIRSNSMPTPSPPNLSAPPGIRGSVSFDNMVAPDDVFYPPGHPRLRRQGAFEQSGNDAHIGDAEGYGHMAKSFVSSLGIKIGERSPGVPENIAYSPYGTKVSMSEIATRKRRKEKSVGDDEDSPGNCDSSCSGSVEMMGDYEFKQGSFDGARATSIGKGSLHSGHSQSDSFDTCPSMCSEDIALVPDLECRKATRGSVIQHTGIVSRPNSFEKSESFDQTGYQSADKVPSSQYSEQSDNDIFEDALSPESALLKSDSMDQQASCELVPLSSSLAAASPGQPYPNSQRLVRQPNIQVPEIRVTEEPDKPEKDTEAPASKEPERQQQHVEEFQLPQRSDTLSQMPTEKLPPKKKRLRLADMEHSSGESSFESTCTSLSRSPSQESNLSHSSSLSMSFDRDEGPKSVSPTKQDDSGGAKQSEFLTVPGSGYSSHHQQREMRRSSSEQAPCTLPTELPEMRSKSFDYGNLPSSRQGETYTSASAMKERRRGYLVRQASLSVYPETVLQEAAAPDISIKQENVEHGIWASPTGSPHSSMDLPSRTKRPASSAAGLGSHQQYQQHSLQQSISEDSLQDEPVYGRPQQRRLQAQSSSSEGEHPGLEAMSQDLPPQYQNAAPLLSASQPGLFWSQESEQRQQQLLKLHIRPQGRLAGQPQTYEGKPDGSQIHSSSSISGRNQQNLGPPASKHSLPGSTAALVQQVQPLFAAQNPGASLGLMVPVRIQTNVPSFGSAMYTSVSQLTASYGGQGLDGGTPRMSPPLVNVGKPAGGAGGAGGGMNGAGFSLSLLLGQVDVAGLRFPELQLNTGIPLSLTSGTISTTDASASSMVAGKRMLSPTSSLERVFETKQQKRVKEERMYGQIVREMGAVELSGAEPTTRKHGRCLKAEDSVDDCDRMTSSPPAGARIAVPVRCPAPRRSDVPRAGSFTPPLQIVTDPRPAGRDSPEQLDVDEAPPRRGSSPEPMDAAERRPAQQPLRFPSLRTASRVSWCFRCFTKPNSAPAAARSSVYSNWCVSASNPNPLRLSTRAALALLRSKQRPDGRLLFTVADMAPPSAGKLVSSGAWRLRLDQLKPELMPVDVGHFGRKMKGVASWDRKEEQVEKEVTVKQPAAEPTRVKIFEGGYKSNEDYVYVRGRGRGKYICEECGIRCKKPSMLKKHIRTHTDVRPYVCRYCNFAFKTKGNLTKHMKSKAHLKKCLELGVSMSSVEDGDADDAELGEEGQRSSEKPSRGTVAEHQFSDADESEDDGDEVDEDDEDEDDYDGDSTRSRSASPQPYVLPSIAAQQGAPDLLGPSSRPPLFGYFTTVPSIRITPQAPPPDRDAAEHHGGGRSRLLAPPSSMDEDAPVPSPDLSSPSSRLSSPGLDLAGSPSSSPCRYLSPRRDVSPHAGHLSPRRDGSPLRHVSPKRDLGVGGYRRDLSPRRGHLSVLSPLSRPASPGGRDYKRDLSPRGRHRAMIRPLSPRRGVYHHSPHSGAWSPRPNHQMAAAAQGDFPLGRRCTTADMETDLRPGSWSPSDWDLGSARSFQSGPPHQVLFSHLPTHSQLQVRSPFPMIPIGGIQMVQSVPTSVTTTLGQQGAPAQGGGARPEGGGARPEGGGAIPEGGGARPEGGGARAEQEESIHTCTKAIASLCLDPECVEGGGGGGAAGGAAGGAGPSSAPCPDSHQQQQQRCSSPPPPGSQHFSSLDLRPSSSSCSSSSSSSSPAPLPPSPATEQEKEAQKKDAS